jgi:FkbM family methyltransferase
MNPRTDNRLVIYHVGGDGDYGPAMEVAKQFPNITTVVVFDAREDTDDGLQASITQGTSNTAQVIAINRCVDETAGEADFYINKFPLSSSLLPVSRVSATEDPVYPHCRTWAENAELDHAIRVKTTTIDEVVASGLAPPPDIISIDAQGAELRILRGAKETIRSHVLAVVSEIEFSEIYAGQGLFDDQMRELSAAGFRFVEIQNSQYWHPGPAMGLGFHTVGEAVWIRYCGDFPDAKVSARGAVHYNTLSGALLTRLAAIAYAFGRLSYVTKLLGFVANAYPEQFGQARGDPNLRPLIRLYEYYVENFVHYRANHRFFIEEGRRSIEKLLPSNHVLRSKIVPLRAVLYGFENLTGWRITRPLRAVKRVWQRWYRGAP